MRRVVVTGLGLVTPLGGDVETTWANIIAGRSGATRITRFDPTDYACQVACEVKPPEHEWGFDPDRRVDHKVQRQVDPFIIYGLDAAGQAIEDAGLTEMTEQERYRAGVSIGSGIGGLPGIEKESLVLAEKGPRRVSPHFVHGRLINLISGQVSIKYGLMGPNHAVVTACSTGAHSIGDAARPLMLENQRFLLDPRQAADPRADRYAGAVTLFLGHVGEAGILDRLAGGVDAVDDEVIDLPLHLVIDPFVGIEAIFMLGRLHLAGDLARIVGRIEAGNARRAALARKDVGPGRLDIAAQRCDEAQTGDDDAAHAHTP